MTCYKTAQRFVVHRGRTFHFVSYEGHGANEARAILAVPATWFLMSAGKRFAVMPQELIDEDETEKAMIRWLDEHIFDPAAAGPISTAPPPPSRERNAPTEESRRAKRLAAKRHYR